MKRKLVPVVLGPEMEEAFRRVEDGPLRNYQEAWSEYLSAAPALTDEEVLPLAKWLAEGNGHQWEYLAEDGKAFYFSRARAAIAAMEE